MKRTILAILILSAAAISHATANAFKFRNYSLQEGLAQSQVYAMIEDSRGYLWMGTMGGGLCQFDGQQFKVLNTSNGLPSNFVLSIFEDSKGDLWIGTHDGVSQYNGKEFRNFLQSDSSKLKAYTVVEWRGGKYIGTSNGLYLIGDNGIKTFAGFNDHHINDILVGDSCLWLGTNKGLYKYTGSGDSHHFSTENGLNDNYIQSMEWSSDTGFWIGTYGNGLNFFDVRDFNIKSVIPKGLYRDLVIYDLLKDGDGQLWIATQNRGIGRLQIKEKELTWLTETQGLANNHVRNICKDQWGNLWFGTSGGGVSKYYGRLFKHIDARSGLPGSYIYSVFGANKGEIWVGVSSSGVVRIRGNEMVNFGADSGFANVKVKAITRDRYGRMWFGTEGSGIAIYDTSGFQWITTRQGLSGNYIKDLQLDSNGVVWVATLDGGITAVHPAGDTKLFKYREYVYLKELPSNRIFSLTLDSRNRIWFGTENKGVGYISGGKVKMVASGNSLNYHTIRAMRTDSNDVVYMATSGGVFLYQKDSGIFHLDAGLTSDNLYLLEWGPEGRLYVGSERGLDVISFGESLDVIDIAHYGRVEGFTGIETCQNAAMLDSNGILWFGTVNGLTSYNPLQRLDNSIPPVVGIEQVNLFYEPLDETQFRSAMGTWGRQKRNLILPWDQNHISFDFKAINLNAPELVTYQWKLEGLDENWSTPGTRSSATYANLPPGKYTFMVYAYNEDMVKTAKPATWTFTITNPFWQKLWFRILVAVFLGLVIFLVIFSRFQQLRKRAKENQTRLTMERDLLELESKALQLQMNPHFIFHALNSIQAVIRQKDEKTARHYLGKFSRLMRSILENSREEKIPLESEIEALKSYVELEQFCAEKKFDFSINYPDDLEIGEIFIPPMLIQPFAENAIIHGLRDIDRPGLLQISFKENPGYLICEITDNGVGLNGSKKNNGHKSTAMQVTQERLASLSSPTRKSSLTILSGQDLPQQNGTKVVMKIALDEV